MQALLCEVLANFGKLSSNVSVFYLCCHGVQLLIAVAVTGFNRWSHSQCYQ